MDSLSAIDQRLEDSNMTLAQLTHRRPVVLAAANSAATGLIAAATGPIGGLIAAVALGAPWAAVAIARRLE